MTQIVARKSAAVARQAAVETRQFVTIAIDGQPFGIPVLLVHDVLGPQRITRIPLAPAEVAGSLNLRGRIVTAIDLRRRLGMRARPAEVTPMSVVVEEGGELYSLLVDSVGEVLTLPETDWERHPPTMDAQWRENSTGIYRLNEQLLVVLDVSRLLALGSRAEAA